jgi:hypothetical protein
MLEAIAQIREALTNLDGSKTGKGLAALDSLEAEVEKLRLVADYEHAEVERLTKERDEALSDLYAALAKLTELQNASKVS